MLARSDQQGRKRHHQYLVGDAVDVAKGADQGFLPRGFQLGPGRTPRAVQLAVDPAHQVVVRKVANEQEERVRGLIQSAVAKVRPGQGARIDVVGLGAGEACLVVSTTLEMPVAAQLRAGGRIHLVSCNRRPGRGAMPVYVVARDAI